MYLTRGVRYITELVRNALTAANSMIDGAVIADS